MSIQTWCIQKLNHDRPATASAIGDHGILVRRPRFDDVVAYCPDSGRLPFTVSDLDQALKEVPETHAFVVVSRPVGVGVFELAASERLLVASFGHFQRALDIRDVSSFMHPEEEYLRGRLTRRPSVTRVTRVGMRAWTIERNGGRRPLTIVTHDRYEFTDDEMWQLVENHPGLEVDAFVVTNPSSGGFGSRVSTNARNLGITICNLDEFLGQLENPWN